MNIQELNWLIEKAIEVMKKEIKGVNKIVQYQGRRFGYLDFVVNETDNMRIKDDDFNKIQIYKNNRWEDY